MEHLLEAALIGGLAAAVLVAVGAVFAALRVRASVNRRIAEVSRSLADGLGYTSEYAASVDLDEISQRTLAAITSVPGIDGAVILLAGHDGRRSAASLGLSDDEIERIALQMPANDSLRSVEVAYRYRLDEVGGGATLPRAGLIVPLRANGQTIGSICGVSRAAEAQFAPETAEALEGLARKAGPALANAQLFAQLRLLAEFDSLTALHNRRSFDTVLEHETSRARRYHRSLALIMLDVDDFKRINDRVGHLAGDDVLAEVGARIRSVVRSTDIAARVGGDEFAVILPESERAEAELLAARIAKAVAGARAPKTGALTISAGVAELGPDDEARELFERADEALYQAKTATKVRHQNG
jgi:diguanylate cyclase (GGDEF)-like protein